MTESPDEKRMRLRYAGACRLCGAPLSAGTPAVYERSTGTVRCIDCSPAAVGSGVTDGSVTPPRITLASGIAIPQPDADAPSALTTDSSK